MTAEVKKFFSPSSSLVSDQFIKVDNNISNHELVFQRV